jgi:DNA-directed RNA polymerase sigma subunit (sigma70/sigma32)
MKQMKLTQTQNTYPSPVERIQRIELANRFLSVLNEEELKIVSSIQGLDGIPVKPSDAAKKYGLTLNRTQGIYSKAMRKMRAHAPYVETCKYIRKQDRPYGEFSEGCKQFLLTS